MQNWRNTDISEVYSAEDYRDGEVGKIMERFQKRYENICNSLKNI